MNCKHQEEAKLLTVKKAGPNTGRQFYTCAKPQGEQCDFFQFADELPKQSTPQTKSAGVQEILAVLDMMSKKLDEMEQRIISQCAPK